MMFYRMLQAVVMVAALSSPACGLDWTTKMFETTSHDFGTVARGQRTEFAFVLENLYVEDVHIAAVRASCSCTTPEIKTETLKTHQKGAIIAKYNTSAFLGPRGATLTVTFDKPFLAEVQLNVHGTVVASDRQSPDVQAPVDGVVGYQISANPALLFLGIVEPGQTAIRQIVVRGKEPFQVTAVTCRAPGFEIAAPDGNVKKSLHFVPVTFVASMESGRVEATIHIETSLGAVAPIPAYADVATHRRSRL